MPVFKVLSEIQVGKVVDGEQRVTIYPPGSKIDLTLEEAVKLAHAIENPPSASTPAEPVPIVRVPEKPPGDRTKPQVIKTTVAPKD